MENKKNFTELYGNTNTDLGRRASLLRAIIITLFILVICSLCIDIFTHSVSNNIVKIVMIGISIASFLLLLNGYYVQAAYCTGVSLMVFAISLSFNTKELNAICLYRNIAYFVITLIFPVLFKMKKRLLISQAAVYLVAQLIFVFAVLAPTGIPSIQLITTLLATILIYVFGVFLLFKQTYLSVVLENELTEQHKISSSQVTRISTVLSSSETILHSLLQINGQVSTIRTLISESADSMKAITTKLSDIDHGSEESISATEIIGNRIDFLNLLIQSYVASLQQSSAAINQMVASIKTVADSAERERSVMDSLAGTSAEGEKQLELLLTSISQIAGSIDTIQNMVSIINNIAEQTNLLSMNAAIEAAHAGVSGKGFAVVAEEIRKLADTSAKNSNDISNHLKTVIKQIHDAVAGSTLTKQSFAQIQTNIAASNQSFDEIANATSELSSGGQEILQSIHDLGEMSIKIKDGGKDITSAQKDLKTIAKSLKTSLEQLTTETASILDKNNLVLKAVEPIAKIGEEGAKHATVLQQNRTK